jgi:hypothetical protein
MYSDAYGTTVPEDLLTSAADRATELVRRTKGMDLIAAASLAVRRLFCPCVWNGSGCDCGASGGLADAVVREVAARARARLER